MSLNIHGKVKVKVDGDKVTAVIGRHTKSAAERAAARTVARAKARAPVDTGVGRASISYRERKDGFMRWSFVIGTSKKYMLYQEYGTKGSVARPGGVLRFKPKGSSVFIFRKKTGPVPAKHFLRDAVRDVSTRDFAR